MSKLPFSFVHGRREICPKCGSVTILDSWDFLKCMKCGHKWRPISVKEFIQASLKTMANQNQEITAEALANVMKFGRSEAHRWLIRLERIGFLVFVKRKGRGGKVVYRLASNSGSC